MQSPGTRCRGERPEASTLVPITLLAWILGTFQPLSSAEVFVLSGLALAEHPSDTPFTKQNPLQQGCVVS